MSYVPVHDRPPYYANLPSPVRPSHQPPSPRYAPPDTDPSIPLAVLNGTMSAEDEDEYDPDLSEEEGEEDAEATQGQGGNDTSAGVAHPPGTPPSYVKHSQVPSGQPGDSASASSRKRRRLSADAPANGGNAEAGPSNGHGTAQSSHAQSAAVPTQTQQQPKAMIAFDPRSIAPSFFNITARNPVTRTIGEFILAHCRGKQNVEVEIKLGTLLQQGGQRWRSLGITECILPPGTPIGGFKSDMTKQQHSNLNKLLNDATNEANPDTPDGPKTNPEGKLNHPIRYKRHRQIDYFYQDSLSLHHGKLRVSKDMKTGEIIECIRKKRFADLNVSNGTEVFDYRVSVNSEIKCDPPPPETIPDNIREKDRLCYKHQFLQVDLTYVKQSRQRNAPPEESYELEIEVLDVPKLVDQGLRDEAGIASHFDEIIGCILDTARILIRNVD